MKRVVKKTIATITLLTVELLFVWAIFLTCIVLFLYLGSEIIAGQELGLDKRAFAWADEHQSGFVTTLIKGITFMASRHFITAASLILIAYFLFIKKHRWYSLKVPVIAIGSISLNLILKFFFDRPRPMLPHLVESSGLSFPSGHSMVSASFYGLILYLVWVNVENKTWRYIISFFLLVFIVLIGFSRIYLHVHYASDVMAGFAAGFLWVIIAVYALKRIEKYTKRNVNPVVMHKDPEEKHHPSHPDDENSGFL